MLLCSDATDSASINAPTKPFSRVGFRNEHIEVDSSSTSSSDSGSEVVPIDGNGIPDPAEKGKGG